MEKIYLFCSDSLKGSTHSKNSWISIIVLSRSNYRNGVGVVKYFEDDKSSMIRPAYAPAGVIKWKGSIRDSYCNLVLNYGGCDPPMAWNYGINGVVGAVAHASSRNWTMEVINEIPIFILTKFVNHYLTIFNESLHSINKTKLNEMWFMYWLYVSEKILAVLSQQIHISIYSFKHFLFSFFVTSKWTQRRGAHDVEREFFRAS